MVQYVNIARDTSYERKYAYTSSSWNPDENVALKG